MYILTSFSVQSFFNIPTLFEVVTLTVELCFSV
jgi:hypothetical protein